jgi:hypothetical protein
LRIYRRPSNFIYTLAPKTSLSYDRAHAGTRGWYLQPKMGIVTDGATTRSFVHSLHAERGRQCARPLEKSWSSRLGDSATQRGHNMSKAAVASDELRPIVIRREIRPRPLLAIRVRARPGEEAVLRVLEDGDPGGGFGVLEPLYSISTHIPTC